MNSSPSGSSALASCLAIGRWTRPWKSSPTSMPAACAASTRLTTSSNSLRRADPVELGGGVHLDRREALARARLGRVGDLVRPVAADPGVGADLVAHLAAEHLPRRQAERLALQVPQRLLEPGQRRHQHRPAAIEAAAIGDLPDVLDAVAGRGR